MSSDSSKVLDKVLPFHYGDDKALTPVPPEATPEQEQAAVRCSEEEDLPYNYETGSGESKVSFSEGDFHLADRDRGDLCGAGRGHLDRAARQGHALGERKHRRDLVAA